MRLNHFEKQMRGKRGFNLRFIGPSGNLNLLINVVTLTAFLVSSLHTASAFYLG